MNGPLPTVEQTARLADCISVLRNAISPVAVSVGEAIGSIKCSPDGGAVGQQLGPAKGDWRNARTAVVLPGSFNPLHVAHMLLLVEASRAVPRDPGSPDPVAALSLSVHTIDKAQPSGMALSDRAWTMHASVEAAGGTTVALLASHGLYLDQAIALHAAMPSLEPGGLWFAIGHDKAVQIFDARYYDDRDDALEALFRRAGLLVAPRAGGTAHDLRALTQRPENQRFADRVRPIAFPAAVADLSSSAVRAGQAGERVLPAPVAAMIAARRCYD